MSYREFIELCEYYTVRRLVVYAMMYALYLIARALMHTVSVTVHVIVRTSTHVVTSAISQVLRWFENRNSYDYYSFNDLAVEFIARANSYDNEPLPY
jgi:hypothetical protein